MRIAIPSTVFFLIFATAQVCFPYDCATPSEKETFRRADVVFEGEVIRIAEAGNDTAYTFRVLKTLKGAKSIEVVISDSHTTCGYRFHPDTIYRVYAKRFENKLTTWACAGNKVLRLKRRNISQAGS